MARAQDMIGRKEIDAQWLDSFVQGVAHHYNNSLTVVNLECYQLRDQIKEIEKTILHCSRVFSTLQWYANIAATSKPRTSLRSVLEAATTNARMMCGETASVTTKIHGPVDHLIVDGEQISRALKELFQNAIDAMPNGGQLQIESRIHQGVNTLENDRVLKRDFLGVRVTDTGSGLNEEAVRSMFLPFFTTKLPAKNLGMGLPIVRSVVEAHQGFVRVESAPRATGTQATIYLPLQSP